MSREAILIFVVVVGIWFLLYKLSQGYFNKGSNQRRFKASSSSNFKQKVQNAFPKYTVLLRSQSVMICELDTRGQPEELVVIRIVPNASKSLSFKSRILVATYPNEPSVHEMRRDFQNLRN